MVYILGIEPSLDFVQFVQFVNPLRRQRVRASSRHSFGFACAGVFGESWCRHHKSFNGGLIVV